jgi:hypothetical protein
MRHALILAACFCTPCVAEELPDANPAVQAQLKKTHDAIRRIGVISYDNVEVFGEAQKVKELIAPQEDDDDEIVRLADQVEIMEQLAVFVATTESSEDTHVLGAWMIWRYLGVSPEATIRVLAPYLDSSDDSLRGFARDFIQGHEDFDDFKKYVSRNEEIPDAFIKVLYERSPGQALLIFQRGSVDARAQLRAIGTAVEARQQGRELTPEEREEIDDIKQKSERKARESREIRLAEHIVSNALWLHKHGFNERFQAALPEARAELEKLVSHKQWWARLYVAYIMRQNKVLPRDGILRKLAEDENALVREAATSGRGQ